MEITAIQSLLDHVTYKNIIQSVVLYGVRTWSPTLREEHRLRLLENKMLRRIFGPKRDEVMGGWRKLHNEELHSFCRVTINDSFVHSFRNVH
jgi:hypothetical protein